MEKLKFNRIGVLAVLTLGTISATSGIALAQVAPPLGQADGFAVLAGSGISSANGTAVTGDIGVSPGTAIVGFPPGTLTGSKHSNDATAQGAQADLTTAYNTLAGEACNTVLSGTDLGGLTLAPAVYCFSSSAALTGTLTLDAQNHANAVWVFQIGSTLTTATNSSVVVINGGSSCNVFWQIGSSATLGTAAAFEGNIVALTGITMVAGATSTGRVLARNGAVTMDDDSVSVCTQQMPVTLQSFTVD